MGIEMDCIDEVQSKLYEVGMPKGTYQVIIDKLSAAIEKFISTDEFAETLANYYAQRFYHNSADAIHRFYSWRFKSVAAPLIILGSMTEENMRQALMQAGGDGSIFVTRPISLIFLLIAVFSVLMTIRKQVTKKRA